MDGKLTRVFTIHNEHGLHMRTAAMLAKLAKNFDSALQATHGEKTADCKSTVGLMMLGIPSLGQMAVQADGEDAVSALDALDGLMTDSDFVNHPVI